MAALARGTRGREKRSAENVGRGNEIKHLHDGTDRHSNLIELVFGDFLATSNWTNEGATAGLSNSAVR